MKKKGIITALAAALCVAAFAQTATAATNVSNLAELKNAASVNGTEITLTGDITATQTIVVTEDITLNLAGYTIDTSITGDSDSRAIFSIQSDAAMTVNDSAGTGRISGNLSAIDVYGNTAAGEEREAINSTLIINGGTLTAKWWVVNTFGNGATLEVNGGMIQATGVDGYAISGNGSVTNKENNSGTIITINGGKIIGGTGVDPSNDNIAAAGIYHPQGGTLTINGGEVSGYMGIQMKSGTLNVTGGTITANGDMPSPVPSHNGATRVGAAISLITCYAYKGGDISASISGDAVIEATGADSYAIYEGIIEDNKGESEVSKVNNVTVNGGTLKGTAGTFSVNDANVADVITITGGSFGSNVSEELGVELPLTYNEETGTYDMPKPAPSTPQHSGGGGGGCSAGFGALALLAAVPLLRMRKK